MKITLASKEDGIAYQIRSYSQTAQGRPTCFEVYRWRQGAKNSKGEDIPDKWVSTGQYPSSLVGAVECVSRNIVLTAPGEIKEELSPKGLLAAAKQIDELFDRFTSKHS